MKSTDEDSKKDISFSKRVDEKARIEDVEYSLRGKYDLDGIDVASDGRNLRKTIMTAKLFTFIDNSTMHGIRYVFMKNANYIRR